MKRESEWQQLNEDTTIVYLNGLGTQTPTSQLNLALRIGILHFGSRLILGREGVQNVISVLYNYKQPLIATQFEITII